MHLPFEVLPRRSEAGRFQAESTELHALRLAQVGRGVAPSTVSHNIQDVLALVAPGVDIPSQTKRVTQLLRGEVTLAGEAMAAWKFAWAVRIISFGWDESTKFGNSVFSCNARVQYSDGSIEDICLRGLSILPEGGKSATLLAHIEERILGHSRRTLRLWMDKYDQANGGDGSWLAAGYPNPDNIGLHRLCEDTVLMSDTCNGARCTKRMLADAVMRAIEEKVGKEAWEALSPEERGRKYKVYRGDCWQHLRNIIIDAMAVTGDKCLKDKLGDDLVKFSSFERIEPEGGSAIRAVFKQFHKGGEYCKGRGREAEVWRRKNHRSALYLPYYRAVGNRQDVKFDGCVAIFWNRVIMLEFLYGYINCPKSENILDKSLYTILRCNEFVGLLRANTLWKYLFSEPFRWLSGKAAKIADMSLFRMGEVLELVEKAMEEIVADPRRALDPTFDIFGPLVDSLPEFKDWREEQLTAKVRAEDGTTEYCIVEEVMRRAQTPLVDSGEWQATDVTLEILKAQAERALEKMHDKKIALADKLSSQDGINSYAANADGHARTKEADGNNDGVENKFAIGDVVMRMFRNISVFNTSGIVQQHTAHDFDQPLFVPSDRRKRKQGREDPEVAQQEAGFFWRVLDTKLRGALVDMSRRELSGACKTAREEKRAHDEEKLSRREESLQLQLNAAVDKYARALELYDQWKVQGVRDRAQLKEALKGLSANEKIAELRRQIEMRTVGCGWTHFRVQWGYHTDEKEATIKAWTAQLLEEILPYEISLRRKKQLPAQAAPPQLGPRVIKELGTVDVDALRIEARSLFNIDNLLARATAERERREAAGISDSVEAKQQPVAPAFDINLGGKQIEVCWPYKLPDGKIKKIWASGKVKRVADGLTDQRSARAKKILPAGALLWAWDADPDRDEAAGTRAHTLTTLHYFYLTTLTCARVGSRPIPHPTSTPPHPTPPCSALVHRREVARAAAGEVEQALAVWVALRPVRARDVCSCRGNERETDASPTAF